MWEIPKSVSIFLGLPLLAHRTTCVTGDVAAAVTSHIAAYRVS